MPSLSSHNKFDKNIVTRRTAILAAGGLGFFGVLGARLYQLQVLQAENYRTLSDNNRFNFNMLLPERGEIRDRFGVALARNRQNYRLVMIPERTNEIEKTLDRVSRISSISEGQRARILKDIRQNPKFVPILVKDNVDWETFSAVNMRLHALPGIVSEAGQGRSYPKNGVFSHVLGYIGRAGQRDIEVDEDPLEFAAKQFATEDEGDDSGGVCVIDVITGELRTLLSMPTFDSNQFVTGITQAAMDRMNNDPKRPQYNKAIAGGYPPASTFKMVVMLAALESGVIDPNRTINCAGKVRLGNRYFHCWKRQGHGKVDMRDALKFSCDTYFYEISQLIGIDPIANVARRLGLGEAYDISIGGSIEGIVPTEAWKRQRLGTGWRTGDTLNASIGQGFVLATPLQLATMTARIANAANAVVPNLIIGQTLPNFEPLDFDPAHLAYVRDAMWSVTSEAGGTAFRPNPFGSENSFGGIEMAGKTGTGQVRGISRAERESGVRKNERLPWRLRDHSIFVGFAPYDRPRFAVGTIVEHGGSGAKRAANISRAVLGEALRRDGLGGLSETDAGALN